MLRSVKQPAAIALVAFVAFLVGSTPAHAQGLTGAIEGAVKDQTGSVIPGVTVTLSSPALIGGVQQRVTAGDGRFRFPALPPGTYTVSFELAGFDRVERQDLLVQPDRTLTLDQALYPAGVEAQVTVRGESPVVDIRNTQVATTVDSTIIEQVPVSRRFTDLLNVMPGVQNGLYTFSPVNAVYGSKVTDNAYTVDGVNFVDPNVSAPVTDIPFDDIQQVQVSTSGQSAEFGSASGGVFNFITKSGGNQFEGLASGYLQNKGLTGNNIDDELAAQGIRPSLFDHVYDWGGNLGGPILRDRMWFFGSYYRFDQEQSFTDFPVPIPTKQWQTTAKVDAQLNTTNRVGLYYNYRDRSWTPFNFGFRTAEDPRTWIGIGWRNHLIGSNWNFSPDSKTFVEVRGGGALFDLLNLEPNVVPGTPVYIEQTTGVVTGGPNGSFGTQQRDRYEARGSVTRFVSGLLGGDHEFKIGFGYEALRMNNSLRDQAQADDLRHQLLDGEPYRVQLLNVDSQRKIDIGHTSGFLEDRWAVGDRVTLNLGIRFDNWGGALGPDLITGGTWFEPEQVARQDDILSLTNVAPRLGIAWDVTGDRRVAVKASYGRFYQRVDGTTVSVAQRGRTGTLTYDWIDRNGDLVYQPGEEGVLRGDSRPVGSGAIDEDLKMPYTDSFNVGVEMDLPAGFGLAVNGIFKRERDVWNRIDLARPFDTAYDAVSVVNPLDGSPMTVFSVKPEFQAVPPNLLLTNPSDPVQLFRDYDGVEFVLKRRLQNRWMTQVSYNLGRGHGTVGTLFFDHQNSVYSSPNNLVFVEGDQQLDRRHMLKLIGLVELPYRVMLSGHFEYLSGLPLFTSGSGGSGVSGAHYVRFLRSDYPAIRTTAFIDVPGEPQGSRRLDDQTFLDFRLERRTRLNADLSVDVMLDVFNVFNANTITRVQSLNTVQTNFLRPAEIMNPRAARIGFRVNF